MASLIRSFSLSDKDVAFLEDVIKQFSFRSASAALSFVLNMAANNPLFLKNNSTMVEYHSPTINLPGMSEAVVRSQMQRFSLSSDEYQTIVRDLVDRCAASKTPIKNPEGMIFGACKRYAAERDAKKDGGQPQKDGGDKAGWLKIQDEMY